LILHGFLYGYAESDMSIIKRGHRIFCSNRHQRKGCGKTFSLLLSTFIKNFTISTHTLWRFVKGIAKGLRPAEAFRQTGCSMERTSPYRLLRRLKYNQVRIRTCLTSLRDPPGDEKIHNPLIQTILHLKHAFHQHPCPISAFQYDFQRSFL
jgi:hypothetical protein